MTRPNKIIAISDLHLGQTGADNLGQYSLLSKRSVTNLVREFTEAAARFADGDPVTLLIAGDGVDLSLAYAADALADLRDLIFELRARMQLAEIVYVIGNHDHHLWSLHSEDSRLLGPLKSGQLPQAGGMYRVTPDSGEAFSLLQPMIDAIAQPLGTQITIAYPSFVRVLADGKLLYVTHGHLFGGLYTELSELLKNKLDPAVIDRHDHVAAIVNHPVIEAIYWLLGETGEGMGADGLTEVIYTDIQKGKDARVRALVERLVAQVLPHGVLWRVLGGLERRIIVDAIMVELDKAVLSPQLKSVTAADRFADVEATRAGLRTWLNAVDLSRVDHAIVLYGHTHVRDEYTIPGTNLHSYNLGTWLVEPNHDAPKTGFLAINGGAAQWVDVQVQP